MDNPEDKSHKIINYLKQNCREIEGTRGCPQYVPNCLKEIKAAEEARENFKNKAQI